jgi:alpha-tubulin suppressor-like RCC1 family protein
VPDAIPQVMEAPPYLMAHRDTARLVVEVIFQYHDGSSPRLGSGARVAMASSDSTIVAVAQDTAPSGSDSLQRAAASLGATLYARKPGLAVITITPVSGTGIAQRETAFPDSIWVLERWLAVGAGTRHSCALSVDSMAYCWGGSGGLLGDGSAAGSLRPAMVSGLNALKMVDISAGGEATCAREKGGLLYCWGVNEHGEMGNGSLNPQLTAGVGGSGSSYSKFSVGGHHACAEDLHVGNPAVSCWGEISLGQLGDGILPPFVPCEFIYDVLTKTPRRECRLAPETPVARGGGEIVHAFYLSTGGLHSCAIFDDVQSGPKSLACWGVGTTGQLGEGAAPTFPLPRCNTDRRSYTLSILCRTYPRDVQSGPFLSVTAGWDENYESHTCALKVDSLAYCWGKNAQGQIGTSVSDPTPCTWNGDSANSSTSDAPRGSTPCLRSPAAVETATRFSIIRAGAKHTCAIGALDSLAYCWGSDSLGQLGDQLSTNRPQPRPVTSPFLLKFTYLSVGAYHTCGVTSPDGAIYCWGAGGDGQLGNGSLLGSSIPVRVAEIESLRVPPPGLLRRSQKVPRGSTILRVGRAPR